MVRIERMLLFLSLILATFTCRFVFPLVSLEGRQLWLVGLLPLPRGRILHAKFAFAMTVTMAVALSAMTLALVMLKLEVIWAVIHLAVVRLSCVSLTMVHLAVVHLAVVRARRRLLLRRLLGPDGKHTQHHESGDKENCSILHRCLTFAGSRGISGHHHFAEHSGIHVVDQMAVKRPAAECVRVDEKAHTLSRLNGDGVPANQKLSVRGLLFAPQTVQVHGVDHHGVVVQNHS